MATRAAILGCAGPELTADERLFFSRVDPWGFILFARNVEGPAQLRRLTSDLRAAVARDAPILVDQEGGRVARLRAPSWREWLPALDECARLPDVKWRARAMRLRYGLIAAELAAAGIDANAAPVLDLVHAGTHPVIRDRAYGADPDDAARIGRAVAAGLLEGGVLPVMKHIPGHGRAGADSHTDLPRIGAPAGELARDFAPFRALRDLPIAMTAHVVYEAIDANAPGTLSPAVIGAIRNEIGFDGLLMTDDLSMHALSGPFATRVERAAFAGCDVMLHCNGNRDEAAAVIEATPVLAGRAAERAAAALALRGGSHADTDALEAAYAALRRAAHA